MGIWIADPPRKRRKNGAGWNELAKKYQESLLVKLRQLKEADANGSLREPLSEHELRQIRESLVGGAKSIADHADELLEIVRRRAHDLGDDLGDGELCGLCGAGSEDFSRALRAEEPSPPAAAGLDSRPVNVANVKIGERFRDVQPEKVDELIRSLQGPGGLLQPIGVTSDGWLVWGAHRLMAARRMGWTEIPARVMSYAHDDRQSLIDELDENLRRSELTALEQSRAIALRKTAYEALHPASRRGAKGGRKPKNGTAEKLSDTASLSFADDVAKKTGKSKRTILRAAAIGKAIDGEAAKKIAKTAAAKKPKELAQLAKLDPDMQRTVATMLANGEAQTVSEAIAEPVDKTRERELVADWLYQELRSLHRKFLRRAQPVVSIREVNRDWKSQLTAARVWLA